MSDPTIAMANANSHEEIIRAAQTALIEGMRKIIKEVKSDSDAKTPGLTWDQIDNFLAEMGKKKLNIIEQEYEG